MGTLPKLNGCNTNLQNFCLTVRAFFQTVTENWLFLILNELQEKS